jgi:hypothetical protein
MLSFGTYFIPEEWISLGQGISNDDHHYYYKVVPTDGGDPRIYRAAFLVFGVGAINLARCIKRKLDKSVDK